MASIDEMYAALRAGAGNDRDTLRHAVERTLEELRRKGRLEPVDSARVQVLRQLAAACDYEVGNAALWRQMRDALGDLTADAPDAQDEAIARWLADAGTGGGPEVRDAAAT
jgi:hypothetical protein